MPVFCKETFEFLFENRMRDSKDWYDAHKPDYRRLVADPLLELTAELGPAMLTLDSQLGVEPKRCVSRLRRDTRYTKDKSLYRDVIWCVFLRDKKLFSSMPGFVFECSPRLWRYGMGYWQTDPATMACAREMILEGHPAFQKALEGYESQTVFHLEGDCYKRPHFPSQPDRLRDWLERRSFFLAHNETDFEPLYQEGLAERLLEGFRLLKPLYEFFWAAEDRRRLKELG